MTLPPAATSSCRALSGEVPVAGVGREDSALELDLDTVECVPDDPDVGDDPQLDDVPSSGPPQCMTAAERKRMESGPVYLYR